MSTKYSEAKVSVPGHQTSWVS